GSAGSERGVIPQSGGDRLFHRRPAAGARRTGQGAAALPRRAREGAAESSREAADRGARKEMRRKAALWVAIWGGSTALALFLAVSTSLTYKSTGRPANWAFSLARAPSEWGVWGLPPAPACGCGRRVPHRSGRSMGIWVCCT